jgi:hypothetical protein
VKILREKKGAPSLLTSASDTIPFRTCAVAESTGSLVQGISLPSTQAGLVLGKRLSRKVGWRKPCVGTMACVAGASVLALAPHGYVLSDEIDYVLKRPLRHARNPMTGFGTLT